MTRLAFILALLFTAPWEEAEIVDVKDLGPGRPQAFNCQDITRSSIINAGLLRRRESRRTCSSSATRVYHQYCDLPKDTRDAFLNAPSMGRYFKANIEGDRLRRSGPYACRTHKVPSYQ